MIPKACPSSDWRVSMRVSSFFRIVVGRDQGEFRHRKNKLKGRLRGLKTPLNAYRVAVATVIIGGFKSEVQRAHDMSLPLSKRPREGF